MGLLDQKSRSANTFKIINSVMYWYDYDTWNESDVEPEPRSGYYYSISQEDISKLGLEENVEYPVSLLINADFSILSNSAVKSIRTMLSLMDLLNESDRLKLNELGIKEEHVFLHAWDLKLSYGLFRALQDHFNYLWEILDDNYEVTKLYGVGEAGYNKIREAVNELGYDMKPYKQVIREHRDKEIIANKANREQRKQEKLEIKANIEKNKAINEACENLHKVESSKKVYCSKIESIDSNIWYIQILINQYERERANSSSKASIDAKIASLKLQIEKLEREKRACEEHIGILDTEIKSNFNKYYNLRFK